MWASWASSAQVSQQLPLTLLEGPGRLRNTTGFLRLLPGMLSVERGGGRGGRDALKTVDRGFTL